jgi:Ca2+-binding RTX toxin-like protein
VADNAAPTGVAISGDPAFIAEMTQISLTGAGTDVSGDTVSYDWAVTKDGKAFDDGIGAKFSFTPDDEGMYVVTLTASDEDGGSSTDSATITVTNVAPVLTLPDVSGGDEGQAIHMTATATDVGLADDLSYAWTAKVGGLVVASGDTAVINFTPDDNGTYVVEMTVSDGDGGTDVNSRTIVVANVDPEAEISGSTTGKIEGSLITLTGSATDAGAADEEAGLDLFWTVTSGETLIASGKTADIEFTPDDDGTYTVMLTATDKDGGENVTSVDVEVENTDPVAKITSIPENPQEGDVITLGSDVTDAGVNDTFTYEWSVWVGENQIPLPDNVATDEPTFTVQPMDNGDYTVRLIVTDNSGGTAVVEAETIVGNVDPTATLTGPTKVARGEAASFTATFADVGMDDTHTIAWDFGDGSKANYSDVAAAATHLSHAYAAAGKYTVSYTVTDNDGGSKTVMRAITVSAAWTGADPNNEGKTALFVGGTNAAEKISLVMTTDGQVEVFIDGESQGAFTINGFIYVWGMGGNDKIGAAAGFTKALVIDGGAGDDAITGGDGVDSINGGAGNDVLQGMGGNDQIIGGTGNDRILGSDGNDKLDGGDGSDSLYGGMGNDVINGGAGNDLAFGGDGDDQLNGLAGDDHLNGGNGRDRVNGGDDNDVLEGGSSNDTLTGGLGDDWLFGSNGADKIYGQDGNDTIVGGRGADLIDGGLGSDTAQQDVSDSFPSIEALVVEALRPAASPTIRR